MERFNCQHLAFQDLAWAFFAKVTETEEGSCLGAGGLHTPSNYLLEDSSFFTLAQYEDIC